MSNATDCASTVEIEQFLEDYSLVFMQVENYIELDQINPMDQTLKQIPQQSIIARIDNHKKPKSFDCWI